MRNYYGSWLGVSTLTVTPKIAPQYDIPKKEGALIVEVAGGGPAEEVGLKENDVIKSIDGQELSNTEEMRLAIQSHGARDQIEIWLLPGQPVIYDLGCFNGDAVMIFIKAG